MKFKFFICLFAPLLSFLPNIFAQKTKLIKIVITPRLLQQNLSNIPLGLNQTFFLSKPKRIINDTLRIKLDKLYMNDEAGGYCDFCFESKELLNIFCENDTVTVSGQFFIPKKTTIDFELNSQYLAFYFGETFEMDKPIPIIIQKIYDIYWTKMDYSSGIFIAPLEYYIPLKTGVWILTTPSMVKRSRHRLFFDKKALKEKGYPTHGPPFKKY
jgi:hypothetical protein